MDKGEYRVQLRLSPEDQLGHSNPNFGWDFTDLVKQDYFKLPLTEEFRQELIKAISDNLNFPEGHLDGYRVAFKEDTILVLK